MAEINVYQQYFAADCSYNGVKRHAVSVLLISTSKAGCIKYEVAASFFPHNDPEDFAVSYDAFFSKVLYESTGRRSRKREEKLMKTLREEADTLFPEAVIHWDSPLREPRWG